MQQTKYTSAVLIIILTVMIISGCIGQANLPTELDYTDRAEMQMYYLATDKERESLHNLDSESATREYLDQFWKKYDPTPDTDKNELRDIYMSRLEYANTHFREGKKPGYRTDRGRIYIIYGPPDEIIREEMLEDDYTISHELRFLIGDLQYMHDYKAIEVWMYDRPSSNRRAGHDFSGTVFLFADLQGIGFYTQMYSTEEDEINDARFIYF